MVMTAEDRREKARARYAKKKRLEAIKKSVSGAKITKVAKAYLANPKRKPKKIYKTEKAKDIAKSMIEYHKCCKSHKCGKKYGDKKK